MKVKELCAEVFFHNLKSAFAGAVACVNLPDSGLCKVKRGLCYIVFRLSVQVKAAGKRINLFVRENALYVLDCVYNAVMGAACKNNETFLCFKDGCLLDRKSVV